MNGLHRKFLAIGARLSIRDEDPRRPLETQSFTLDVGRDRKGEVFDLTIRRDGVSFRVADVQPKHRHLLLIAEHDGGTPQKFLCGHDERHWFIAEVHPSAANVTQALEALKPVEAVASQRRHRVKKRDRNRRKNPGFVRQGEWFFIPVPDFRPASGIAFENEPIQRGRSKPHIVEELYRRGGRPVYVAATHPRALSPSEHAELLARRPEMRKLGWRLMSAEPEAYGRGRVRHPDHKTIVLPHWHRIVPNREVSRPDGAMANLFLD